MISSEQTARIACSFISTYYKRFVDDLPSLAEFYGDNSSTSFARVGEAVATTSQGKHEVQQYLERLNLELGPHKVQVRHADFVPTADGSIAVTVNGVLFTKRMRQGFSQSFVLTQTKYRPDGTMYISADSLRFTSQEAEVIPANAIVIAPGQDVLAAAAPAVAAATTTLPPPRSAAAAVAGVDRGAPPQSQQQQQPLQERKERPPRKERAPRVKKDEPQAATAVAAPVTAATHVPAPRTAPHASAANNAAPAAAAPTMAEKVSRDRKPRDAVASTAQTPGEERPRRNIEKTAPRSAPTGEATSKPVVAAPQASKSAPSPAAAAAAPSSSAATEPNATGAPKPERSLTSKVRLVRVPKDIRLSNVRTAAAKYGKVVDAFWVGEASDDAVVVLSTPDEARALQADRAFAINEKAIRRNFFFDTANKK